LHGALPGFLAVAKPALVVDASVAGSMNEIATVVNASIFLIMTERRRMPRTLTAVEPFSYNGSRDKDAPALRTVI